MELESQIFQNVLDILFGALHGCQAVCRSSATATGTTA
jgi:hypothetical protein